MLQLAIKISLVNKINNSIIAFSASTLLAGDQKERARARARARARTRTRTSTRTHTHTHTHTTV